MSAHELRRDKRRCEYRSACGSVLDWLWLPEFVLVSAAVPPAEKANAESDTRLQLAVPKM